MFIHNLKYSLKILFKSKALIFWTFAFPIILGTFFNLAFSNIETSEKLNIIDIAYVENINYENNSIYKQTFDTLSNGDNKLFNIKYVDESKAKELLDSKEITGYIVFNDEPKIVVATSGINQTVLKTVTEEISQNINIVENISKIEIQNQIKSGNQNINYEEIYKKATVLLSENNTNIKDISSKNLSYTMIEFYTLIAMTCLYGGILGMVAINQNLANMSNSGKRVSVSPTSKLKLVFSSVIASYMAQLIGLILLFMYTIFVLKVDYGTNLPMVILLALVGSLAGLSLGIAIATLFKAKENTKTGIVISFTMLGCFLSGMMGITMKYVIDKNIPIINKLNPASMITDGLYSLYYYDTMDRFYFNIISLLIFSFILISLSMVSLRRQKYDSI